MIVGCRSRRAEDGPGLDPRRDEDSRNTDTEAVKSKAFLPWIAFGVRTGRTKGWMDVVVGTSVLIVGDHKQGFGPGRRLANGVPDVVEELLAGDNIVWRVFVVGIDKETGLEKGVLCKFATGAVLFKGVKVVEVIVVFPKTPEHEQGKRRDNFGITINTPVCAHVFEHVEYVADIPVKGVGDISVIDVAI